MPCHLASFMSSLAGTTPTPMLSVAGIVPAPLTPLVQMMSGLAQATSPTLCCWHHPSCFNASQSLTTLPCSCLPWQAPPQLPCSALLASSQPLRCTNDQWLSTGHAAHPSLLASSQPLQCLSMPCQLTSFVSSLVGTTSTPMLCITGIVLATSTPLI